MDTSIKKVLHFPIIKIILGISICFLLFIGVQNFISKPFFYSIIQNKGIADPFIHCISLLVLLFGYYFLFRFYDKREISELSLKYIGKEMFGGFALGFLTISLSIVILYFLGYYKYLGITTDHYSFRLFGLLMVAALIEDLFVRGIIVRVCENWLGTNPTLIIGALFELDHLFNPNVSAFSVFFILIWGFTTSMLFIYTKRIWLPFFFHLGWNFAQPFYGSNLTGLNNMGSIIQSKWDGPELLTGGAVGIEESIFTGIFLLLIGVILYVFAKKEGKIIKKKW
ncbi:MAG: CPBP family intramembrane metalloprotease [Raineya sp.]|jgi:membrane protease YdiL (CAAX protease family)|nr:CPBP family intramembrane metalloprotease [Raineya sp.]